MRGIIRAGFQITIGTILKVYDNAIQHFSSCPTGHDLIDDNSFPTAYTIIFEKESNRFYINVKIKGVIYKNVSLLFGECLHLFKLRLGSHTGSHLKGV